MLKLHGFAQSGNTFKVAFMLNALGLEWQPVAMSFADFVSGATRDAAWRANVNPMGEVPVLEDESGDKTVQSGVILTKLAREHGRFGGTTDAERDEILGWLLFDNHKFTANFATWRFMKAFSPKAPDPALAAYFFGRINSAFGIVDKHLAGRAFIVGDALTIADFSLCGYLFYPADESGIAIDEKFPHLAAWRDRLRSVPGWADPYDVLPGERVAPLR